ncbi:energy transducer TonB [Lacihabitans sp. CCS-44]|uniref:energy transducer TonB n=1 Tax=Lacihabitans sp. CCS-44 TaxID=2487331 RepID=UPI0020CD1AEF|nr:energy transducer TonB [Lacihabitans sp. CCS-44]MCP9754820.1 energy transducer TonB [Lacihabitans sp. CCS-44]
MKNLQNLDDIIFENRNKEYGAYFLRKNYSRYLTKAMIIGSSFFVLLFGGAFTYNKYILPNIAKQKFNGGTIIILPPQVEPPQKIVEVAPPPPEEKIEQKATITYLPPEPVIDDKAIIEMTPPTQEDMDGKAISNKTVDGNESAEMMSPPPAPEITRTINMDEPDEQKVFISVEQQPQFPNGEKEMYKFLSQNINYPATAVRANVSGKVYLKFVVEKDGSIANIEIVKGIGFGCDEEAIKVIKSMPNWSPGKQNGKAVRVYFNMPVVYRLD